MSEDKRKPSPILIDGVPYYDRADVPVELRLRYDMELEILGVDSDGDGVPDYVQDGMPSDWDRVDVLEPQLRACKNDEPEHPLDKVVESIREIIAEDPRYTGKSKTEEPSIEEILGSIRRIIGEDEPPQRLSPQPPRGAKILPPDITPAVQRGGRGGWFWAVIALGAGYAAWRILSPETVPDVTVPVR